MSALYFIGGVMMKKIVLSMLLMLTSFAGTLAHAGDSTSMLNQGPALGKASSGGKYASSFINPSTGRAWNGSAIFRTISFPTYYTWGNRSNYTTQTYCSIDHGVFNFNVGIRMNGNVFQTYISRGSLSTGWTNGYARLNLGWVYSGMRYISFTGAATGYVNLVNGSLGYLGCAGKFNSQSGVPTASWGITGISKN